MLRICYRLFLAETSRNCCIQPALCSTRLHHELGGTKTNRSEAKTRCRRQDGPRVAGNCLSAIQGSWLEGGRVHPGCSRSHLKSQTRLRPTHLCLNDFLLREF